MSYKKILCYDYNITSIKDYINTSCVHRQLYFVIVYNIYPGYDKERHQQCWQSYIGNPSVLSTNTFCFAETTVPPHNDTALFIVFTCYVICVIT